MLVHGIIMIFKFKLFVLFWIQLPTDKFFMQLQFVCSVDNEDEEFICHKNTKIARKSPLHIIDSPFCYRYIIIVQLQRSQNQLYDRWAQHQTNHFLKMSRNGTFFSLWQKIGEQVPVLACHSSLNVIGFFFI